jgi:hypothetical protein
VPRAIGRVGFALTAVVAGFALQASAAGAKPITKLTASSSCRYSDHDPATACDPGKKARDIVLAFGSTRVFKHRNSARLASPEPLLPGETVVLSWKHPSKRAELIVNVATPTGPRTVILGLFWRPATVSVTAENSGALHVVTPTRSAIVPADSASRIDWNERDPKHAAKRILGAAARLERSYLARLTFCTALHPEIAAAYQQFTDDVFGADECAQSDSRPDGLIHYSAMRVRVLGTIALLKAKVRTSVSNSRGRSRHVTRRISVLLAKDAAGVWRLATPEQLLPYSSRPASLKRLRRVFENAKIKAREYTTAHDDDVRLFTTPVALEASPPCSSAVVPDPSADVFVSDNSDDKENSARARHQDDHAGIDITGAGITGDCLVINTRGKHAVPSVFVLDGNDPLVIYRSSAGLTVINVVDGGDEDSSEVPATGIHAYESDHDIVIKVPYSFGRSQQLYTSDSYRRIDYSDELRIR